MEYHRFTKIWPLLKGDDFNKLKADIKANGLRLPILTYQGEVLDGRNRERACEAVGSPPRYEKAAVKNDNEALDLVVSLNEHRRHLSNEERAFAAARLANMTHGHYRKSESSKEFSVPQISLKQAAKRTGTSPMSANRARAILKHGTKEDEDEVVSRKATLNAKAAKVRPAKKSKTKAAPRHVRLVHAGATAKFLTPEEVNPNFKGTPIEFTDQYGHVQVTTAIQRSTAKLTAWASNMKALVREGQRMPDWPEVQQHWIDTLTAPNSYDIAKLTEAMEWLRPKMAEAELVLERAVAVIKKACAET